MGNLESDIQDTACHEWAPASWQHVVQNVLGKIEVNMDDGYSSEAELADEQRIRRQNAMGYMFWTNVFSSRRCTDEDKIDLKRISDAIREMDHDITIHQIQKSDPSLP